MLLTVTSGSVNAQSNKKSRYHYGLLLGAVDASVSGSLVKTHPKLSFKGGIWFQLMLHKQWTMQTDLFFIEKGAGGYSNPPKPGEYWLGIYYLEVPVLIRYHLKQFSFEAGPGLGILTYASERIIASPDTKFIEQYPFKKGELSFNLGTGFSFNEKWQVSLRFTHSLLPVRAQLPTTAKQVYSRVISITVYRNFKFKKPKSDEDLDRQ